ncbi:MAG: DUF3237 domain-containing protein [Gammaproteobacteria bacterium]|nr:DUF3237 domain-containing protein [Gammaproteobacteria bacterium]
MTELPHRHLIDLALEVDFTDMQMIGATPAGQRRIAPVTGGSFTGDRLTGQVLPGADWVINRPDGVMLLDVRLILKSDDHALIYLTYQGRFLAESGPMTRFGKGKLLDPSEYSLAMTASFECGEQRYSWLNNIVAVGSGQQTSTGPIYAIYEIS